MIFSENMKHYCIFMQESNIKDTYHKDGEAPCYQQSASPYCFVTATSRFDICSSHLVLVAH